MISICIQHKLQNIIIIVEEANMIFKYPRENSACHSPLSDITDQYRFFFDYQKLAPFKKTIRSWCGPPKPISFIWQISAIAVSLPARAGLVTRTCSLGTVLELRPFPSGTWRYQEGDWALGILTACHMVQSKLQPWLPRSWIRWLKDITF
jgi:hypothetical protein